MVSDLPSVNINDDEAQNLFYDAIRIHVDYLVSRSWFNRVWAVQEATLAAELIVFCGHSTMDWTIFARALETLRGALRQVPLGEKKLSLEGVKPAWELVRQRDVFRLFDRHGDRNHHLMANLLGRQMRSRGCTDDRDRVYGMLAMTKSPYPMTPDYTKTVAEVYTDFTRRYSPVNNIYLAGLCRRQHKMNPEDADIAHRDYLPSWVPEFRPSLASEWGSPFTGSYCTARQAPFFFLPDPHMFNLMAVTGTIFDIISTTTQIDYEKINPSRMYEPEVFFPLINQLQAGSCLPPEFVVQPTSEPVWLILAKTLTVGTSDCDKAEFLLTGYPSLQGLNHLEQGSLPWLTAIWDRFSAHCFDPTGEVFQHVLLKALGVESRPFSTDGEIASGFLNYLANIIASNMLFVTTTRYMGLAPKGIRQGDAVAIFNGCNMPYVVRSARKVKYKENLVENLKAIQVIGPCYLHGIMNGEIFTDRNAPRFSRLNWTRLDGDTADSLKGGWMILI
jgi:hypothetical protein